MLNGQTQIEGTNKAQKVAIPRTLSFEKGKKRWGKEKGQDTLWH